MYSFLSGNTSDITNVNIPILNGVPNQAIPCSGKWQEDTNFNSYETKIYSNTSILYKPYFNWDKIYIVKFPAQYSALPALTTNSGEICINMDVSTAKFNMSNNRVSIGDPSDFSTSVLYGVNLLLLSSVNDSEILSSIFHGLSAFVYSMICRIYIREIDFSKISNQDIANMYYAVSRVVLNSYIGVSGDNSSGLAKMLTKYFFTHDNKKSSFRLPYDPDMLPEDYPLDTFESLFKYLDEYNILPSVALQDFRAKVAQSYSITTLLCMSNGLTFSSMLLASRLPSNVFNERVNKISPRATNDLFSAILKHLTKKQKEAEEQKRKDDLKNTPVEWF